MTQNQKWPKHRKSPKIKNDTKSKRPKIKNYPKSKMTQIQILPKFKNEPNSKLNQIQKWPKIKNDQKPIMSQIQKWPKIISRSDATALRAEGAQAEVWSALHWPDHPPFFVFLSFSCFYIYCGSMCSMGSMWAQQSYSAVLHLHLWWYYSHIYSVCLEYFTPKTHCLWQDWIRVKTA